MAIWSAKKVNPRTENDVFKIDVEIYKDLGLVRVETFETTQDQPAGWPGEGVKALIQRLQAVTTLPAKIVEGDVTLPADAPDATADEIAKDAWLVDFRRAEKAKILVDAGVIQANNAKYTALLTRLRNNFKVEYFDIL